MGKRKEIWCQMRQTKQKNKAKKMREKKKIGGDFRSAIVSNKKLIALFFLLAQ